MTPENIIMNPSFVDTIHIIFSLSSQQFKGAGGSADLKITKSAPLSLNHHNFSNTELIYTK